MSELTANSESQQVVPSASEAPIVANPSETQLPNSVVNSREGQPQFAETLKQPEGARPQANQQPEQVVALPLVLQGSSTVPTVVARPISPKYIQKGAKVSSLTHLAIKTFQELQSKLVAHYQKMKQGVS